MQGRPSTLKSIATFATVAGVFLVVLVVVLAFSWYPDRELDHYYSHLDPKDYLLFKNNIRATTAQAIGGVAVLFGLFFAWRNVRTTQDNLRIVQGQLILSTQGQITDRLTNAINQLGSDKLEIRLGAIYALERIANDSERDHWPIVEILTAFIRTHAPWPPRSDVDLPARSVDIQAVLRVLRRRNLALEKQPERTLDLRNVDFRGADLAGAQINDADLSGVHFETATLRGVHAKGANLWDARFGTDGALAAPRTECSEAHFEGATFRRVDLRRTLLQEAHLEGARLHEVDFTDAWLRRAHLEGAHITGATGLTTEQLEDAFGDQDTIIDPSIQRPQAWPAARA